MVPIRSVPREQDDQTLTWLWLRSSGIKPDTIAKMTGRHVNTVRHATQAVKEHDMDHPDPNATPSEIGRAYW